MCHMLNVRLLSNKNPFVPITLEFPRTEVCRMNLNSFGVLRIPTAMNGIRIAIYETVLILPVVISLTCIYNKSPCVWCDSRTYCYKTRLLFVLLYNLKTYYILIIYVWYLVTWTIVCWELAIQVVKVQLCKFRSASLLFSLICLYLYIYSSNKPISFLK